MGLTSNAGFQGVRGLHVENGEFDSAGQEMATILLAGEEMATILLGLFELATHNDVSFLVPSFTDTDSAHFHHSYLHKI